MFIQLKADWMQKFIKNIESIANTFFKWEQFLKRNIDWLELIQWSYFLGTFAVCIDKT